MKKHIKRFLAVIGSVLVMTLLQACYRPGSPGAMNMYAPFYILRENCPFTDNMYTSHWDEVDCVEEDPYGRRYYIYKTNSIILQSVLEVHVISQIEISKERHGYYQDYCYIARQESDAMFADEQILALKENNDWGLPINEERLTYTASGKIIDDKENIRKAVREYLDLDNSYTILQKDLEIISDKQQIFLVRVFVDEEIITDDSFYLIVYSVSSPAGIRRCEKIDRNLNIQTAIQEFRLP